MVRWEKEKELPKQDLEKEAPVAVRMDTISMECYDPDPCRRTSSIDQLVAALCEAFTEGGPQCTSKKK